MRFENKLLLNRRSLFYLLKKGWGARGRTKIHGFKGRCAAIAPRPNDLPPAKLNFNTKSREYFRGYNHI